MLKIRLITILAFISTLLSAQVENDVKQFDKVLNQFLNVRDFCISNDGDEAYFTVQSPNQDISQLAYIRKENKEWLQPELLPFCDAYMYMEPFLSVNGKRLYFVSDRPMDDSSNVKKDFDIWYVDRNNTGSAWSKPKNIGAPINSDLNEFYPTVSENNNLYFTMDAPNGLGKDDIYFCKWDGDNYSDPVLLNENINSNGYEFNAFISRKEDFILFTKYNEEGGQGSGDLYISKRDTDGKWKKATNLGTPINTKYMEYCPYYDDKNQILYFTSRRNDIAPRKFNSISDFKKYLDESNNGLSKIYMTPLQLE